MKTLNSITALLALSSLVSADTFHVDVTGGPGTDFLQLSDALASSAVSDGDVLLVRAGSYASVTIDKALIIHGIGQVSVNGTTAVQDIPQYKSLTLAGLGHDSMTILPSQGTVFLRDGWADELNVTGAADLRIRNFSVRADASSDAVTIDAASRVQMVDCTILGGDGEDNFWNDADDGGNGLIIRGLSRVQLAACDVDGGDGGDINGGTNAFGGDGGDGIQVFAGSELMVSGRGWDSISQGFGGSHYFDNYGTSGTALRNYGLARVSGVNLGSTIGSIVQPTQADPVLTLSTTGSSQQLQIHGPAGSKVILRIGSRALLLNAGPLEQPVMLSTEKERFLGMIGLSGQLQINLPGNPGPMQLLQAIVSSGEGRRMSNSVCR